MLHNLSKKRGWVLVSKLFRNYIIGSVWVFISSYLILCRKNFKTGKDSFHENVFRGIPNRLIFIYRFDFYNNPNLLDNVTDKHVINSSKKVKKTIDVYNASWDGSVEIVFMDQRKCRKVLVETFPKLVQYYDIETGKFQSDMCRIAELYQRGGYYFDIDLDTINPLILSSSIELVLVKVVPIGVYNQEFIASKAGNKFMLSVYLSMIKFYKIYGVARRRNERMGSRTLMDAYINIRKSAVGVHMILRKVKLRHSNITPSANLVQKKTSSCKFIVQETSTIPAIDLYTTVCHIDCNECNY
jgi:hypothetical protein